MGIKAIFLAFPWLFLALITSGCLNSGDKAGKEVGLQGEGQAGTETSEGLGTDPGTVAPEPLSELPPKECFNGVLDSGETGIDCGGSSCPRCQPGALCKSVADCETDPYKMHLAAFREVGQGGNLNVQCVDKIKLKIPGQDDLELPTPDGEKRCISEELFLALFKNQAPQVSFYTPSTTNSPLNAPIGVMFDILMDPESVNKSMVLVKLADFYQKFVTGAIDTITPISATVAPFPDLYSIYMLTPSAPLEHGTMYVGIINGADTVQPYIDTLAPKVATSLAGVPLAEDTYWTFRTEPPEGDPPCPGPCVNGKHCAGGVCQCNLAHAVDTTAGPCKGCETGYLNTELDLNQPVSCQAISGIPAPTISGSIPPHGYQNLMVEGLNPNLGIWIGFSQPMDPESLENAVKVQYKETSLHPIKDMALLESTSSFRGENTMFKFMPINPMLPRQADTTYRVHILKVAKSAIGVNMTADTYREFKTASSPMPLWALQVNFTMGDADNAHTSPFCQFLFRACPSEAHAKSPSVYFDCFVAAWNPHKDPTLEIYRHNQTRDSNEPVYLLGRSLESLRYPNDFYYMDLTADECGDLYYLGGVEVIGYRAVGDNFNQPFDIYRNSVMNSWVGRENTGCLGDTCLYKWHRVDWGLPGGP